ncbi:O-methyltransferase family 3 [Diaporthe helianthi]|uniref:O-methyltransferase family 3 n=1 Tax=Diaporthe helianthi TaxID=158607 RepID=A0A2P5HJW9_DIAHE|nr:O-methyltransferase family 3 [Diaporthe helianthi]
MPRHTFTHNNEFAEETISKMISTDEVMNDCILHKDSYVKSALDVNQADGLDGIDVAPNQGKLFYLLAKLVNAKNILEVGTLGGYSAVWLAKALPSNGKLNTLELDQRQSEVARANIERAGFEDKVEVRIGPALL